MTKRPTKQMKDYNTVLQYIKDSKRSSMSVIIDPDVLLNAVEEAHVRGKLMGYSEGYDHGIKSSRTRSK